MGVHHSPLAVRLAVWLPLPRLACMQRPCRGSQIAHMPAPRAPMQRTSLPLPPLLSLSLSQVESRKRFEFMEMMVTAVDAHLR